MRVTKVSIETTTGPTEWFIGAVYVDTRSSAGPWKLSIDATGRRGSRSAITTSSWLPAAGGRRATRGPEAARDFCIKVADAFERQAYSDDVELVDAASDKVLALEAAGRSEQLAKYRFGPGAAMIRTAGFAAGIVI